MTDALKTGDSSSGGHFLSLSTSLPRIAGRLNAGDCRLHAARSLLVWSPKFLPKYAQEVVLCTPLAEVS